MAKHLNLSSLCKIILEFNCDIRIPPQGAVLQPSAHTHQPDKQHKHSSPCVFSIKINITFPNIKRGLFDYDSCLLYNLMQHIQRLHTL